MIWVSVGRLTTIKSLAFMPRYDSNSHWLCFERDQTINEQEFRLRVTKPWNLPRGRRHVRRPSNTGRSFVQLATEGQCWPSLAVKGRRLPTYLALIQVKDAGEVGAKMDKFQEEGL